MVNLYRIKKRSQMGRPSKNTQMDKNKEKIDVSESPPTSKTFFLLLLFFAMCPKYAFASIVSHPDFLVKRKMFD